MKTNKTEVTGSEHFAFTECIYHVKTDLVRETGLKHADGSKVPKQGETEATGERNTECATWYWRRRALLRDNAIDEKQCVRMGPYSQVLVRHLGDLYIESFMLQAHQIWEPI